MVHKKTPVSGTVFNTLSHGVVSFVASGSLKNHSLTGWDFLTPNQKLLFNGFWSYHSQQNETHRVKEYEKLCRKMLSFLVYHFVWSHLGVWKDVSHHKLLVINNITLSMFRGSKGKNPPGRFFIFSRLSWNFVTFGVWTVISWAK